MISVYYGSKKNFKYNQLLFHGLLYTRMRFSKNKFSIKLLAESGAHSSILTNICFRLDVSNRNVDSAQAQYLWCGLIQKMASRINRLEGTLAVFFWWFYRRRPWVSSEQTLRPREGACGFQADLRRNARVQLICKLHFQDNVLVETKAYYRLKQTMLCGEPFYTAFFKLGLQCAVCSFVRAKPLELSGKNIYRLFHWISK